MIPIPCHSHDFIPILIHSHPTPIPIDNVYSPHRYAIVFTVIKN